MTFQSTLSKRRPLLRNNIIFSLGVALLELSLGQPLFAYKTLEDLNEQEKEDSMTEYSMATRLVNKIHASESSNYESVVTRSIYCNFGTFTYNFKDKEF